MRKSLFALGLVALTAIAFADENYSNVNLGPTLFTFNGVEKDCDTSTEQKGLYCGARAEIDYLVPNNMYMGILGVYAPGAQSAYHISTSPVLKTETTSGVKVSTYLWQVEAKLGRHFGLAQTASIVPYIGIGTYHVDSSMTVKSASKASETSSQMKMDWRYLTLGFSSSYTMNPMLDIGIGFKVLRHFHAVQQDVANCITIETALGSKWGYEVNMPIKIETSQNSQWNVSVEPFYLKMDINSATNVMGARICVQKGF